MVHTISLLPFIAGALGVVLALFALAASRRRNRTLWYFVAMCAATALWSLAYFVVLNLGGPVDPSLAPMGSLPQALFVAEIVGVAASPTYFFLFACAYASKPAWTRGWRVLVVHVPLVYTLLVGLTNPLHHLFVRQPLAGAAPSYGPLAPPHHAMTFLLLGFAIWLIVSASWKRRTRASRRQAIVLGTASMVPVIGGLLWTLRHALGLPLTVNLTPVLFPVLNIALAYELLRDGIADIVPYATLQAFNAISDAAIAVDHDGVVAALNTAARDVLPTAEIGTSLAEVAPDLATTADACLTAAASYAGFDLERGDRVYWGRVRPTRDAGGDRMGCIILLTDVTEVRMTQTKLLQLGLAAESRR